MEVTNEPQYMSATRTWHPSERRDVRRTIDHWLRNTWGTDSIPLLETFDFSPMKDDWGHRFLVCGDDAVERAVFVTYGPGFAQLFLNAYGTPPMTDREIERLRRSYSRR